MKAEEKELARLDLARFAAEKRCDETSRWSDADWQDWNWLMEKDYADGKRRDKVNLWRGSTEVAPKPVVLPPRKPRKFILKTKREVDNEAKCRK